jgi:hypothetical protein
MPARVFLIGLAAALLVAASAPAEEPDVSPAAPRPEALTGRAPRAAWREPAPGHFRWGIPESPFPLMEAERKLVGFHIEFEFGGGSEARRSLVR